jgi:hypothetical protein
MSKIIDEYKKEASFGHSPCGTWKAYEIIGGPLKGTHEFINQKNGQSVILDDLENGVGVLAALTAFQQFIDEGGTEISVPAGTVGLEVTPEQLKEIVEKYGKDKTKAVAKDGVDPDHQGLYGYVMSGRKDAEG